MLGWKLVQFSYTVSWLRVCWCSLNWIFVLLCHWERSWCRVICFWLAFGLAVEEELNDSNNIFFTYWSRFWYVKFFPCIYSTIIFHWRLFTCCCWWCLYLDTTIVVDDICWRCYCWWCLLMILLLMLLLMMLFLMMFVDDAIVDDVCWWCLLMMLLLMMDLQPITSFKIRETFLATRMIF